MNPAAADKLAKRICAQRNQHQCYAELQRASGSFTDLYPQQEHDYAGDQQCDCMTDAPETSNQRRAEKTLTLAYNGRDGSKVVGFDRVLQAEYQTDCKQ